MQIQMRLMPFHSVEFQRSLLYTHGQYTLVGSGCSCGTHNYDITTLGTTLRIRMRLMPFHSVEFQRSLLYAHGQYVPVWLVGSAVHMSTYVIPVKTQPQLQSTYDIALPACAVEPQPQPHFRRPAPTSTCLLACLLPFQCTQHPCTHASGAIPT